MREGWLWYGTLDAEEGVVWLYGDDGEEIETEARALVVLFVDRPAGGT